MSDAALEVLTEEECLARLAGAHYGRVAVVTAEGRPEVIPVNFVLHDRTVVFTTSSRLLISRAPLGHIAFEVDVIDPMSHEGWDVVVKGEGADITDAIDRFSVLSRDIRVDQWTPGRKERWVSIVNPVFSGRRLYQPAPAPMFW